MINRALILLPAMLLGLAASNLATAGYGHGYKRFMDKFDSNGDGKVTLKEFESATTKRFKRVDANGDGAISPDEFAKYVKMRHKEKMKRHIEDIDSDGDGNINKREYLKFKRARAERHFRWLDKNNDGVISGQEIEFLQKRRRHYGKYYFYKMDINRDGRISLTENRKSWANWFNRLDEDHDGVITEKELRSAHDRRRGH